MRSPRLLLLPLVLVLEAGAVAVLHRLGAVPSLGAGTLLAGGAPAGDVLMAAARVVALVLAWWLLATTALSVLAGACRLPAALRAAERVTLPAVRRFVERSLAVTLSLSAVAVAVPAGAGAARASGAVAAAGTVAASTAATGDPVAALLAPGIDRGTVIPPVAWLGRSAAAVPVAVPGPPGAVPGPPGAGPVPPGPGAAGVAGDVTLPREHRVVPGEHLWGLAAAVVAEATGRARQEVLPGEVAAYWVRLVDANPSNLRSGDPDLVYPGEVLLLPGLPD